MIPIFLSIHYNAEKIDLDVLDNRVEGFAFMRNDIRHALGTLINRDFMTLWFASKQIRKYFVNVLR